MLPTVKAFARLIAAMALVSVNGEAWSQDLNLAGVWMGRALVSAGISVGVGDALTPLVGAEIKIDGRHLQGPGETECSLGAPQAQTWQNDMESFGSGGGDWADLGLVSDGMGFAVQVMALSCTGKYDPVALVWQDQSHSLLLDLRDRVYLSLRRGENP